MNRCISHILADAGTKGSGGYSTGGGTSGGVSSIVGKINNPLPAAYGSIQNGGLILFFTNILRFVFVIAGLIALVNIIYSGFLYMMAAGDPKKLADAWGRIWLSGVGLIIMVSSFAIAALFGYLIFGDAKFMLDPMLYGPGD
jgi:hypothetical protein